MTPSELEEIKQKLSKVNDKRIKAKGAIEQLLGQLKRDYKLNSVTETEDRISELDELIEKGETDADKIAEELESLTNWDEM
jgi:DNA repair ATPase RecN